MSFLQPVRTRRCSARDRFHGSLQKQILFSLIGIGMVLILLLLGIILNHLPYKWLSLYHCPFRMITGQPCLTCGGTHVFLALAEFRIFDAFQSNPLVFMSACLPFFGLLSGIIDLATGSTLNRWLRSAVLRSPRLQWLTVSLLAANWLYLILRNNLIR